jgi:hypothetical protein
MNSSNLILSRTEIYLTEEFVRVEIPSSDGFILLKGNLYFSPDTTAEKLKGYFGYLERVLNSHNFHVLLLGDFIILYLTGNVDYHLPFTLHHYTIITCLSHYTTTLLSPAVHITLLHYCNKLKGEAIFSSTSLVGLTQHTYFHKSGDLLELAFSNFIFLISMKYR